MTIYYVGSGGSDSNAGTSWATRKLTLNGAEDVPVVAGDTVYVAPGIYRELLTVDVSGAAGSPITYIGDITGEHTDNIGGIVRITGSNDDRVAARANCIDGADYEYRTFRGFMMDYPITYDINTDGADYWIVEDCTFQDKPVYFLNATHNTIRRCLFIACHNNIVFSAGVAIDDTGNTVENCVIIGSEYNFSGISIARVGGISIKNCTILSCSSNIVVNTALTVGQTTTVNNCIIIGGRYGLWATALGEITEDYNTLRYLTASRVNTAVGANSNNYPPLFNPPLLQDGFVMPWQFGSLSKWSTLRRIADGGTYPADDMFGLARPVTDGKRSRGAIQYTGAARETTTIDGATGASLKLPDAGELFLIRVPVTATSTTFSVKVYREADYAGDLPQMIIRQAGQTDNTTTDTGSAGAWNTLSAVLTPAASPAWVDIVVTSRNTATSGNYDVFFDTVSVS